MSPDIIAEKRVGDRLIQVIPLTYRRARIGIGPADMPVYDDVWWYDTPQAAVAAMNAWDGTGEPEGWFRHPRSGRRRPGGDPAQEYINL